MEKFLNGLDKYMEYRYVTDATRKEMMRKRVEEIVREIEMRGSWNGEICEEELELLKEYGVEIKQEED